MIPYIDIHTHTLHKSPEVLEILNLRAGEDWTAIKASHVSFGVHPWDSNRPERVELIDQTYNIENLVSIGECGLDKFQGADLETQTKLFNKHIKLSAELKKPLIIHCVGYFNELIALKKSSPSAHPWVIHGFTGHPQLANQLVKAGFLLSFGEALTQADSKAVGSVKSLAGDCWFLETDDSNIPIQTLYKMAADIREVALSQLKGQLHTNFLSTFVPSNF
jgi:TatD DNase family protein